MILPWLKRSLKALFTALVLLIIGSVALTLILHGSASRRLDEFCADVQSGTPLTRVVELAARLDLRVLLPGVELGERRWRSIVRDTSTRGEHCMITHDGDRVLSADRGALH